MVSQKQISISDLVTFNLGAYQAKGVVIEDRGSIGVKGRRLLGVRVFNDPYEDRIIEMPEEELSILDDTIRSISTKDIIAYFKSGALIEILMHNTGGSPTKVWLTYNAQGRIVHTFHSERGLVGGVEIPFFVLKGNRIFKAKQGEVVQFLVQFGLSAQEAEEVVRDVGTAP